jgi:hypothetical protein
MAGKLPEKLFDTRTVQRSLRAGLIDRATYEEFLRDLPDASENVLSPDEGGDDDGYDVIRRGAMTFGPVSDLDDEDEDEDDDDERDGDVSADVSRSEAGPQESDRAPGSGVAAPLPGPDAAVDPFADAPLPGEVPVPAPSASREPPPRSGNDDAADGG